MSHERVFANLRPRWYRIASPRTPAYNCMAWAIAVDIEHDDVDPIAGSCYGDPVLFLSRPLSMRQLLGETHDRK